MEILFERRTENPDYIIREGKLFYVRSLSWTGAYVVEEEADLFTVFVSGTRRPKILDLDKGRFLTGSDIPGGEGLSECIASE